jgi:hypothetical protein
MRKGPKPTDWTKVKFRLCTKCGKRLGIKQFYWFDKTKPPMFLVYFLRKETSTKVESKK